MKSYFLGAGALALFAAGGATAQTKPAPPSATTGSEVIVTGVLQQSET